MFKVIGDDESAQIHLAEAELVISDENRGVLKALQFYVLPINLLFASPERFSFSDSELENFTFDSRVFYSWGLLFFKHAILQDSWDYASDCYHNSRLAEFSIKMKTDFPIRNWYRLQSMLLFLELCHLSLLEEGINRAKELVTFLCKNPDFFKIFEKLNENMCMILQLLSQIFHKIKDASFFHLTNNLWRTATKGQITLPVFEGEWFGVDNNAATTAIRKKVEQAFAMNSVGTTITLDTNNTGLDLQAALALFLDAEEIGVPQDPKFAETVIDVTQTPIVDEEEIRPTLSKTGVQASCSLFLDGVRTKYLGFEDPVLFFSDNQIKSPCINNSGFDLEEASVHFVHHVDDVIGVHQDPRFTGTDKIKTPRLFLDEQGISPTQGESNVQATCTFPLGAEEITSQENLRLAEVDLGFEDPVLFFSNDQIKSPWINNSGFDLEEASVVDHVDDALGVHQDPRFTGTDEIKTPRLFLDEQGISPTLGESTVQATCTFPLGAEEITSQENLRLAEVDLQEALALFLDNQQSSTQQYSR